MAIQNYAESWIDYYDNYKTVINFVAGDFNSLKDVIRKYVARMNPENYNDWAESSEVGMFVNGLAYLGETLHYRVDLNAHDIFPSTTERRQSLLNFVKMLSYSPKRNICANGIAKLSSISTTQNIQDSLGNNLKDVVINWNDASNSNWLEQFLTIMNSSFVYNNPFGKPLKKDTNNSISTQLYELNSIKNQRTVYSFTSSINGVSQQFEIVNPDIDMELNTLYERTPTPEQAFHILYRNDGTGNSSNNTGFFVFWKQGTLQSTLQQFTQKIENNSVEINVNNINEYDVWVQELDTTTGNVKNNWTKIANDEYLVYNNTDIDEKNIFKVETKDNDNIVIRFSDGNFGNIPTGVFRFWYRVSQGNYNLYIKPADIKNISVKIPYKSNNTNDDNVYYLSMTFSVVDVSHINQSVVQESLEEIREKSPQVYSTQNRMVTGSDYNKFPKSFGQQVKILKSLVRTYSGNTRYIDFNDPTGTYKDLNIIADDGYMYKQDGIKSSEITLEDYNTPDQIINNNIEPLLEELSFSNFFYNNYPLIDVSDDIKLYWSETSYDGPNTSYGQLLNNNEIYSYNELKNDFMKGNLLLFVNDDNDTKIWCKISNIYVNEDNYEIEINEVLDSNYNWYIKSYYRPLNVTLDEETKKNISNQILNLNSFGLRYNYDRMLDEGNWEIISSLDLLSDDNEPFEYTDTPIYESGQIKDWVMKIEYDSSKLWIFKIRYLDYIYGSEKDISFFFNTSNKNNNGTFLTDDYIKITKSQYNIDNFDKDYYWKPCDVIVYSDGYIDTNQFKVYGFDNDKDSLIDNPIQYEELNANDNLFFSNLSENHNELLTNIIEVDDMWGHTTKTGLYYCKLSGTIYPAGVALPKDITITKNVQLSNGTTIKASVDNPVVFQKNKVYPFDVVDNGWATIWNNDSGETVIEEEHKVESELIKWNTATVEIVRYVENVDYYIRKGLKNISFLWKHFATSSYIIDPSPANIIDMFVLTNTYYNSVQEWLKNGKSEEFPKLPSSYELKSIFAELNNYKMVSDTVVWHPIKYKLLFGNYSDDEMKANFRIIKNENTSYSDNEIKQQVLQAIDNYFSNMNPGEKFYFTKLSTYIHQQLSDNIGTIVIVPSYNDDKFGNLFEISCDNDEILLSSATLDNIQIISKITDHNIRIGI